MNLGTYHVPDQMKDEDKWLYFFTKPQIAAILIALMLGISNIVFFSKAGLVFLGILFALVIVVGTGFAVMFRMPPEQYLMGGGEFLGIILLRILRKQLPWNRKIYVKNYH